VKRLALMGAIVAFAASMAACSPEAQQKIQEGIQTAVPTLESAAGTRVSEGLQTAAPTIQAVGNQVREEAAKAATQVASGIQTAAPTLQAVGTGVAGAVGGLQDTVGKVVELAATWEWQGTTMADGTTRGPTEPSQYTVDFQLGDRLAIQADCNQASGTYAIANDALSVSVAATTLADCGTDSYSEEFLTELAQASGASLEGSDLVLTLGDGAGSMRFTRAQ
jgi:heat shock protein HslJ